MIVVTMTDCPPALRGDLSKWLLEINTGVYVGQVSARVRDRLWERITQNIKSGRAAMVFDAPNEQGMDFRIHNTSWEIVDLDGLRLVRRPVRQTMTAADEGAEAAEGFSKAAAFRRQSRIAAARARNGVSGNKWRKGCRPDCTVVDIETTGLDPLQHAIIEIAALRVRDFRETEAVSLLVRNSAPLPEAITALTGITGTPLAEEGLPIEEALKRFTAFIGNDVLLFHNAPFDLPFLNRQVALAGLGKLERKTMDTCMLARKALLKVTDYRLSTLATHFGIPQTICHRALPDCKTTLEVYRKIAQTE